MYNPLLDTFLAVADCGSFTKAADKLFITPHRSYEKNECVRGAFKP